MFTSHFLPFSLIKQKLAIQTESVIPSCITLQRSFFLKSSLGYFCVHHFILASFVSFAQTPKNIFFCHVTALTTSKLILRANNIPLVKPNISFILAIAF